MHCCCRSFRLNVLLGAPSLNQCTIWLATTHPTRERTRWREKGDKGAERDREERNMARNDGCVCERREREQNTHILTYRPQQEFSPLSMINRNGTSSEEER